MTIGALGGACKSLGKPLLDVLVSSSFPAHGPPGFSLFFSRRINNYGEVSRSRESQDTAGPGVALSACSDFGQGYAFALKYIGWEEEGYTLSFLMY